MHGFFSQNALRISNLMGVGPGAVWLNDKGEEVIVTAVYSSKERGMRSYWHADKQYVGEVTKFVRTLRVRTRGTRL